MPDTALFAQVLDRTNRTDPYLLYARLRETPVIREDDGTYIVGTHAEIRSLLHDQRLSSDIAPARRYTARSVSCLGSWVPSLRFA